MLYEARVPSIHIYSSLPATVKSWLRPHKFSKRTNSPQTTNRYTSSDTIVWRFMIKIYLPIKSIVSRNGSPTIIENLKHLSYWRWVNYLSYFWQFLKIKKRGGGKICQLHEYNKCWQQGEGWGWGWGITVTVVLSDIDQTARGFNWPWSTVWLIVTCTLVSVIWLTYCRYAVKHYIQSINQSSINQSIINQPTNKPSQQQRRFLYWKIY